MDLLDRGVWLCRYLCRRTKVRVCRSFVLPVLLYGCETWTLIKDLRLRLNSFGRLSLRRILGYRWLDFVSNEWFLRETQMRFVPALSMSVSCGCMDMWLVFLMLILLTRFSQRGSLVSDGGQWADHVPCGCSKLISISRRWGWPDGGHWSTGGKWTQ